MADFFISASGPSCSSQAQVASQVTNSFVDAVSTTSPTAEFFLCPGGNLTAYIQDALVS